MSAFGFDVPQGSPGGLDAAASAWRGLGVQLVAQGEAVTSASQTVVGTGGWQGPASAAFVGSAERLISTFGTTAEACGHAATALTSLSSALQHAQSVTRQALADCDAAQGQVTTQSQAADQAGQAAQAAQQSAAAAVHPTTAAAYNRQATTAQQQQSAAQGAAERAQGDLTAAQTRGQQAVQTYQHAAQAAVRQLTAAAEEMKPAEEKGWADGVVNWLGHANDFGGAGSVALAKGAETSLGIAGRKLVTETEGVLDDPAAITAIMNGKPYPYSFDATSEPDPAWNFAEDTGALAGNPVSKVLTSGLPEDTFGALGKVPYLGFGLTGLDMFMNRNDGVGKAVIEPLGNLAVGTTITEGASSVIAPVITSTAEGLAAGDGLAATLAGTAVIPGVGEVVIVGAVAVVGTYAVDKGVTYLWDHRAGIEHGLDTAGNYALGKLDSLKNGVVSVGSGALNAVEHPVSTAQHVAHDLEPWHWSL
jgi:hypothetical protein